MTRPIPVRTLLGSAGFDTSLLCLRSLVEYSDDPIRLVVHEDGTLTERHFDRLREIDSAVEIIARRVADERVQGLLARHKHCSEFRRSEIMALKLFDILAFSDGWASYCDSDFLFLRRYSGLFAVPDSSRPTFMTDTTHAYAVRPWNLKPMGELRLLGRICAGFTVAPFALLDLDYLEWLLAKLSESPAFRRRHYWSEQTCWAALSARTGGADLLDPCQIVMATRHMAGFRDGAVAIHFVSTFRSHLDAYLSKRQSRDAAPVSIKRIPARAVGPLGMAWSDLRRRVAAPR